MTNLVSFHSLGVTALEVRELADAELLWGPHEEELVELHPVVPSLKLVVIGALLQEGPHLAIHKAPHLLAEHLILLFQVRQSVEHIKRPLRLRERIFCSTRKFEVT